jgi:hypothetical protein
MDVHPKAARATKLKDVESGSLMVMLAEGESSTLAFRVEDSPGGGYCAYVPIPDKPWESRLRVLTQLPDFFVLDFGHEFMLDFSMASHDIVFGEPPTETPGALLLLESRHLFPVARDGLMYVDVETGKIEPPDPAAHAGERPYLWSKRWSLLRPDLDQKYHEEMDSGGA